MTDQTLYTPPGAVASKPGLPRVVWVAGGLMAAAIVALAGTVAWQQGKIVPQNQPFVAQLPVEMAAASMPAVIDEPAPPPVVAPEPAPAPVATAPAKPKPKPVNRTPAPSQTAPANTAVASADPYQVDDLPPPPPQVCATCGVVESVETVVVEGKGTGAGAIAGGVVGGVVGNQFGKGGGRTAARLLGAVGGAFAGNAIEKNARSQTMYRMHVRMDDGSRRTITQSHAVATGTAVTVDGSSLRVNQ